LSHRHEKVRARIEERPTRADLTWREVIALFEVMGAHVTEGSGSRVRVVLNGRAAVFHRPHPGKELTKSSVDSVRRFLTEAGVS